MKKIYTILALLLIAVCSYSQAPGSFNYQAVLRGSDGQELTDQEVGMQISIIQYSPGGSAVYVERFTPTTNEYGLVNIVIGTGDVQTVTFSTIDWGDGPYFLKVEIDENGLTTYIHVGTSQLLSVPYALHAKIAESATETDPEFSVWDKSTGINITESQISDLDHFTTANETDPVYSAWNKSYNDLINTPVIIDSINTVLDTTTQFVRIEVDGSVTNEIQNLNSVLSQGTDAGNNSIVNVSQQGIGTATPDASAALEINSTTQGFLPPSMTLEQRELIINPVAGLQIFNSTSAKPNYYDGTEWKHFDGTSAALGIGDFYKGGVIFYVDGTGHGLVCAVRDETRIFEGIEWGCFGTDISAIPNKTTAENDPAEDGLAFSNAIVSACGTNTAASVCRAKTTADYTDWYLPTQYELNLMYQNKSTINATALANGGTSFINFDPYWSSSESDSNLAWKQYFVDGDQSRNDKTGEGCVRAVRAF